MQMAEIYDSSQGVVKIGPCKWSPNLEIAFWLAQNDATILKVMIGLTSVVSGCILTL